MTVHLVGQWKRARPKLGWLDEVEAVLRKPGNRDRWRNQRSHTAEAQVVLGEGGVIFSFSEPVRNLPWFFGLPWSEIFLGFSTKFQKKISKNKIMSPCVLRMGTILPLYLRIIFVICTVLSLHDYAPNSK